MVGQSGKAGENRPEEAGISYEDKKQKLCRIMDAWAAGDVAVAFSGGVDSSLLLKLAAEYGRQHGTRVYALTASTRLHPACDLLVAKAVAAETGAVHVVLELDELSEADIDKNPVDRCYRCKKYIFRSMLEAVKTYGIGTVLEGTNLDDTRVYRPGIRALRELGMESPLMQAGFTKADVRRMAAEQGISVAARPSTPCLATRFPYGTELTAGKLETVEQGEAFLRSLGLGNVRLRVHGDVARVEVDGADMAGLVERRDQVVTCLKKLGYGYVTLDLEGFRSGSMDQGIKRFPGRDSGTPGIHGTEREEN